MMCPCEVNNTVTCFNGLNKLVIFLFGFQLFIIMNKGTLLGALSFQGISSSVVLVSSLDITSNISIFILNLTSHIYIQLYILIIFHFKAIYSTLQLHSPIWSICLIDLPMEIFSVSFPIFSLF